MKKTQPNNNPNVKELKTVIRKTYKVFYYIGIFLLLPTITYYIVGWKILLYAQHLGILIYVITLGYINKRMNKKQQQEKQQEKEKIIK